MRLSLEQTLLLLGIFGLEGGCQLEMILSQGRTANVPPKLSS